MLLEEIELIEMVALSQHILGRHIWDVPISMNSNSSVQVINPQVIPTHKDREI